MPRVAPFTSEQVAEIVTDYQSGVTILALSQQLNRSYNSVRKALMTAGAYERGRRADGLTVPEIAERLQISKWRSQHIARYLGLSAPMSGEHSRAWRGGRHVDRRGYCYVFLPADDPMASMRGLNCYVPEHRLVMARSLGRPLARAETVHHINGDRADNRLENLQLRKGQHGKGVAYACVECGSHNVIPIPIAK
jgi:hypothetical protein